MGRLDLESVDLRELALYLSDVITQAPLHGYFTGKTALRDAVTERLCCSMLDAEELVDMLVTSGVLRFSGDPAVTASNEAGTWSVRVPEG